MISGQRRKRAAKAANHVPAVLRNLCDSAQLLVEKLACLENASPQGSRGPSLDWQFVGEFRPGFAHEGIELLSGQFSRKYANKLPEYRDVRSRQQ
jgi:hypothetical protein